MRKIRRIVTMLGPEVEIEADSLVDRLRTVHRGDGHRRSTTRATGASRSRSASASRAVIPPTSASSRSPGGSAVRRVRRPHPAARRRRRGDRGQLRPVLDRARDRRRRGVRRAQQVRRQVARLVQPGGLRGRAATTCPRRWPTSRRCRRPDAGRRRHAVVHRHRLRRRHRLAVHRLGRGLHAAAPRVPTSTTSGSTTRSRSTTREWSRWASTSTTSGAPRATSSAAPAHRVDAVRRGRPADRSTAAA